RKIALLCALSTLALARAAWAADFTVGIDGFTAYTINGVDNSPLTLVRGRTYTFAVNSPGHPFYIKTAQVTAPGSTYDAAVTNNGLTSGTLTFVVPTAAPSTLYYQCSVHAVMTGVINVVSAAPVAATGRGSVLVLATVFLIIGGGVAARRKRPKTPSGHAVLW